MAFMKVIQWLLFGLLVVAALLTFTTWLITWHPTHLAPLTAHNGSAPTWSGRGELKVMSWNVQYMAGKNYVFFYDILDGSGPDTRPSRADVALTFTEVVRVIKREAPDVILLQEVDDGAARTGKEDQLARLRSMLGDRYPAHVSTWYWKAAFVPHPKIMGAVGMRLAILSRFRLGEARHHALPLMPGSWVMQQFNIKRAILEVTLPSEHARPLTILNTHLDAFAQGSDTMERQVAYIKSLLDSLTRSDRPFIIAGDFNLLMPGAPYNRLGPPQRAYFKEESELKVLTGSYRSVPSMEAVNGAHYDRWFTHFPNDPAVTKPDRTIDYFFLSPLVESRDERVLQGDTVRISDHFPLVVTISLKKPVS